ncbi:hypothetical protein AB1K70_19260 [Bremerella sp. JC770]|uniref:hypothetical protein n=1 Tax=Bremerella sp. JC770 TaxID=3232137 RepID=UPI0034591D51
MARAESGSIEVSLEEQDYEVLAEKVFQRIQPLLDPHTQCSFLSEKDTAQWLGISHATLKRLRNAGFVSPSRSHPLTGYSREDRDAIVKLMSDQKRSSAAMASAKDAPTKMASTDDLD